MPTYTPYERQRIAAAFKAARKVFEDCKCQYICTSLRWACTYVKLSYEDSKLAQEIVMQRLQGHRQLESWLQSQGFFIPTEPGPKLEQKLHNHRMQWLDMLIAEFDGEKS